MNRRPWLGAAGLSLYVCLVLWAQRTGGSRFYGLDLLGSSLIVIVAVGIGWLAGGQLTRDSDRRGLIALVAGLWGLLFSTFELYSATLVGSWFQSELFAAAIWTVICASACWLISRGRAPLAFVTRVLGFMAIVLLATQSVQAIRSLLRETQTLLPERSVEKVKDRRDGKSPDVFVFILDKYSSGAWLSHTYGYDQGPFEDSLRALGFVVPTAARANYAHTQLALASFLNWRLFATPTEGQATLSWDGMREQIGTARAWDVFHKHGYRVFAFATTFPATRTIANADVEVRPSSRRAAPFGETWWVNSPLASWTLSGCHGDSCEQRGAAPYPLETLHDTEWKLKIVQSLSDSAGPVIAFVHLLSPHEPYVFNADCSPSVPWWPLTDQGAEFDQIGVAYATQVKCLDRMLLRTVRTLVKRPGVRPVIILQADHGHGRISVDPLRGFTLTEKELTPDQLGERLGIFAAYLFPGADTAVYNDISPVNVMPLVLRSLFGTVVPPQPDRSFWSAYQDAFTFTEIAAVRTHPPMAGGRDTEPRGKPALGSTGIH